MADATQHQAAAARNEKEGASKRRSLVVEGAATAPSLEGVVDLEDSVDTEVITRTLPPVVHEHVIPQHHEIREERIERHYHTHEYFHRILPVIETKVLPIKHYILAPDGKSRIEIPASEVHKYTLTGSYAQNWSIQSGPPNTTGLDSASRALQPAERVSSDAVADGPVIGLARGEPAPSDPRREPAQPAKSANPVQRILEPILSSKKSYVTEQGIPRTEYTWHHPPEYETATGATQPIYIGPGLGDLSGQRFDDIEEEQSDVESEVAAQRAAESGPLYRESGYGSGGVLPGLTARDAVVADQSGGSASSAGTTPERQPGADAAAAAQRSGRVAHQSPLSKLKEKMSATFRSARHAEASKRVESRTAEEPVDRLDDRMKDMRL